MVAVGAAPSPGSWRRRSRPGDLRTLAIADWVESVVADIEAAGLDDIVIVGHSMAGITVPGVATQLGPSRIREMVFACAFVPPEGTAVADTLAGPLAGLTRRGAKRGTPGPLNPLIARLVFFNGMSRAQRQFIERRLCAESARIPAENVSRRGMPDDIPRTWILTERDRALSPKSQRRSIEALGGVQTVIPIDTCHDLMVSEPRRLAEILVERCRQYR